MANLTLDLHLPQELEATLETFLRSKFSVLVEPETTSKETLYDTFDWRLYRARTLLRVTPSRRGFLWSWCSLDGQVQHETWEPAAPGLLTTLEDGALRRKLRPIISMRRLLPRVELSYRSQPFRIVDDEEKTRVRIFRDQRQARRHASLEATSAAMGRPNLAHHLPSVLRLRGLRGYDKTFRAVEEALRDDLGCQQGSDDLLVEALEAVETTRFPGDYASKPQLSLDPSTPAAAAACQIHRVLLEVMLRNEAGLRRDDDSEFLHDFRVAVRRTRSALSQIKRVFAPEPLAHFRAEFSWLGSLTGPTRDLDVFLLKMDDYRSYLPAEVATDLDPLTTFLETKQRREHRALVKGLDSLRYRRLIDAWSAFLAAPAAEPALAANAEIPIVGLASSRIWKLFRRVIKDGGHILRVASDPVAHANALHDLRIECKKLRYSLEFFRSLYPRQEVDPLIRALKKLQDNLGDFNDYEVQRHKLAALADEMMPQETTRASTLLAMGRLMNFLSEAQERERLGFEVRFLTFTETTRKFKKLFATGK